MRLLERLFCVSRYLADLSRCKVRGFECEYWDFGRNRRSSASSPRFFRGTIGCGAGCIYGLFQIPRRLLFFTLLGRHSIFNGFLELRSASARCLGQIAHGLQNAIEFARYAADINATRDDVQKPLQ